MAKFEKHWFRQLDFLKKLVLYVNTHHIYPCLMVEGKPPTEDERGKKFCFWSLESLLTDWFVNF